MTNDTGGPYGDVKRARVGAGELRQHDVYMLDEQRTLVLGVALGPPRLWNYLLEVALLGFVEGYEQPHDGRACTRLNQGMRMAQQRLRTRAEALIERRMPDVGLLAFGVEGAQVQVVSAGPLRLFLRGRRQASRRLGPEAESSAGVLKGSSAWSSEQVEPGDLLFAGSLTACSAAAVAELDHTLARERPLGTEEIVQLLNRVPASNGTAALAVAMRVPSA
jgi:hypothetical protein